MTLRVEIIEGHDVGGQDRRRVRIGDGETTPRIVEWSQSPEDATTAASRNGTHPKRRSRADAGSVGLHVTCDVGAPRSPVSGAGPGTTSRLSVGADAKRIVVGRRFQDGDTGDCLQQLSDIK